MKLAKAHACVLFFLPSVCGAAIRGSRLSLVQGAKNTKSDWETDAQGTVEGQCDIQRQYGPRPVNCPSGNDRWSYAELEVSVLQFAQFWAKMKTKFWSPCCMGLNHRFVLHHTIRALNPLVIIESGVAAGHTTWLLREVAGPNVPIFSLDPDEPTVAYSKQGWKDPNPQTRYFTGSNFVDLAYARWDVLIPDPRVRAQTLVIIDDHQSAIERLKMIKRWGFGYAYYDDNYPFALATSADSHTCKNLPGLVHNYTKELYGDAYSPQTMCGEIPQGTTQVLSKDQFGAQCKFIALSEHQQNVHWMQTHIKSYFEFPAVFSPCANVTRPSLLGDKSSALQAYGFPSIETELWHYGHLFPCVIEMKPLAPGEIAFETHTAILATLAFRQQQLWTGEPLR
eukprot:gnl/MRDRNA2_/MRDRNA2_165550_c0_seq1.p1 gnl/MRDRNA2_/MRDRNA2_165550_c0~~gnl/MRDRNA2_/MRDRNA2_165550_c0_seq1.p1  ORF type:complete len:395 (+),score=62.10 gnl/MRDRNA2_/MRDRNA2_165550_c0_seq1:84-1268(+)